MRTALVIVAVLCSVTASGAQEKQQLKADYDARQWFELRREISGSKAPDLYAGAVAAAFNQNELAEEKLRSVIRRSRDEAEVEEARQWLIYMYFRAGQYRRALPEVNASLKADPSSPSMSSFRELLSIVTASPDLSVAKRRPVVVDAKLVERNIFVPLEVNGRKARYILDTGANLSLISQSEAKRLGLKVADASKAAKMTGSTGREVGYELATAPRLVLAGVEIRNVIFLVFRDDQQPFVDLPEGERGVLGLPVLLALKSFRWQSEGKLAVGVKPSATVAEPNLCFDGADPIVEGEFGGVRLPFLFDTGSQRMDFYPTFAKKFGDLVEKSGQKGTHRLRGVEGSREVETVTLPEVKITVGGFEGVLRPARILLEETGETSTRYYGRMGMEFLGQARQMTVDFETMKVQMD